VFNKFKSLFKNISVFDTDVDSMPESEKTKSTTFTLQYDNLAVGELNFDGTTWNFHYTKMFQNQTKIEPIPSFPIKNKAYKSSELWPFFQSRIPSLKQPKIKAIINSNGIQENDIISLLRLFGGKSINNPFVLQG
jgi:HipA-like protein